jgi:TonB family protein
MLILLFVFWMFGLTKSEEQPPPTEPVQKMESTQPNSTPKRIPAFAYEPMPKGTVPAREPESDQEYEGPQPTRNDNGEQPSGESVAQQTNSYSRPGIGGVSYPACVYCPDPKYSEMALKAKFQGTVALEAVITADGQATDVQVVKGLGLGLDEKAVEAVKSWRFKPALGPNGEPVAVQVPIEVTFRLK